MEDLQRRLRYPDPNHLDALANVLRGGAGDGVAAGGGGGVGAAEAAEAVLAARREEVVRVAVVRSEETGENAALKMKALFRHLRDAFPNVPSCSSSNHGPRWTGSSALTVGVPNHRHRSGRRAAATTSPRPTRRST